MFDRELALNNAIMVWMFAETYYSTGCNHISSYPGYYEVRLHLPCENFDSKAVREKIKQVALAGTKFEIDYLDKSNTDVLIITWDYLV